VHGLAWWGVRTIEEAAEAEKHHSGGFSCANVKNLKQNVLFEYRCWAREMLEVVVDSLVLAEDAVDSWR
jgi:hypothetical protein